MAFFKIFVTISPTDPGAPILDGLAVTGTNTYYSKMISGADADGANVQLSWTGTPTGTFTLWYSDKDQPNEANDNDWVQDAGVTITQPAGAAGKEILELATKRALRKRLKYVNASGSGTLFGYAHIPKFR